MVEVDGELVDKFIRQTNMKITEAHDTNIIEQPPEKFRWLFVLYSWNIKVVHIIAVTNLK